MSDGKIFTSLMYVRTQCGEARNIVSCLSGSVYDVLWT